MLRVWVHGFDPGRVSDGSRLALCQTLSSLSSALRLSFSGMCVFVILVPSLCRFCFCLCFSFALVGAL